MSLETLAAWGEFIGGIGGLIAAIAVVASLIFVGVQIRSSVRQANVDSYSTITSLWTNFTNAVSTNENSWQVFHRFNPVLVDRSAAASLTDCKAASAIGSKAIMVPLGLAMAVVSILVVIDRGSDTQRFTYMIF